MLSKVLLVLAVSACTDAQTSVTIGGAPGKYGEIAFKLWAAEIANMADVSVTLDIIPDGENWTTEYESKMPTWDIVIAPYTSAKSLQTVNLVNGAKPVIVWGGASESIFTTGLNGVFGTFTPASHYFDAGLEELNSKMDASAPKKVEFVENESPFSDAVCKGAIAKAEALGFEHAIVEATKYNTTNTNAELKAVLAPVVAAAPNVVVVCGHEDDVVKVVHAMAEDKLCPAAVLCTNCLNTPEKWSGADAALKDHLIMPAQWSQLGAPPGTDGDLPWTTKDAFVTAFKASSANADQSAPTYHQASALLSGIAIAQALKAMNGAAYDQATFIANMKSLNLKTIVGEFKPDATTGANSEKPMVTEQYQPDSTNTPKVEIVAPAAVRTAPLAYPRSACLAGSPKTSVTIGGAPGKYGEIAFKLWAAEIANMADVSVTLDIIPDGENWTTEYESKMSTWDIIIAPYTSAKSLQTVNLVNGAKPVIVWGGASESIFAAGLDGVFGTFTPASHYFDAGLEELNSKMDASAPKKVEFVENESPFSDAVCKGAIAKAEALDFKHAIAEATRYNTANTNDELKAVLAPVVAANPNVVVVCGHEDDVVRVVHAMAEDKLCPAAVLCTNCLNKPEKWSGDDATLKNHLIMPAQWSHLGTAPGTDGDLPWTTKDAFVTAFKASPHNADQSAPTYHQASALLSGIAIARALKAMNGAAYDQATFIANMKSLNLKTIVGEFKPDATTGANSEKPMVTEQYQPDSTKTPKIEIVAPAAVQTSALAYPRSACLSQEQAASGSDVSVSGAPNLVAISLRRLCALAFSTLYATSARAF